MNHATQRCHLRCSGLDLGSVTHGGSSIRTCDGTTSRRARGEKRAGGPMTDTVLDRGRVDGRDEVRDRDCVVGKDRAEEGLVGGRKRGAGGFFGEGSECAS